MGVDLGMNAPKTKVTRAGLAVPLSDAVVWIILFQESLSSISFVLLDCLGGMASHLLVGLDVAWNT